MAKLIFGCGYLGRRVARLWRDDRAEVFAVTRSARRVTELIADHIQSIVGDVAAGAHLLLPDGIETVLYAVGHSAASGKSTYQTHLDGLAHVLQSLPKTIERFIYISSTGVYGQTSGEEVDENSPCQPTRESGRACLAAEKLLRSGPFAQKTIILRLAGIYGPGRIPRAADLKDGKPIDAPAEGWLNLIHVEDVAQIVRLAEQRAMPPQIYVASDGHPVQRRDYFAELARLIDAPPPLYVSSPALSPAHDRATSDKRVNPRRLFTELAPRMNYPSYREGLASIVESLAASNSH
jgi:nucleoside-diphosphate-sugar epimerase